MAIAIDLEKEHVKQTDKEFKGIQVFDIFEQRYHKELLGVL